MRLSKKITGMSLRDQEKYLVEKLQKLDNDSEQVRKLLGKVRGGQKVDIITEERPDECK